MLGSILSTSTYCVLLKYNLSPGLKSKAKFDCKPVIFSALLVASYVNVLPCTTAISSRIISALNSTADVFSSLATSCLASEKL